ncbi:2-phosphosulfolactate phosphatase [Meiothermus hypogaeus]|uniref:Probable 2-phosphosulfolactate phosphatase n=2 Tax=Meiothermus hypogaeus TaxID=884155 RepID=A0A511QZQ1_9DEIN|nr:2-phosphosulfolactate phosphatase [Meiothermus hypogaeus]RIH79947.1 putative 2-phosphosulfolactate phosphatase [Meiothermus hypogaeus]GEM82012.1 putative 2-phosphosulfolactate phosphatase [Meiothermus hypogaeus NBRC 106114]GIW35948.1 MAG: putative 2-phosphosulfolactate phosphatase [Meiothermus sp.]
MKKVRVYPLPPQALPQAEVMLVVDVIRATSTAVMFLEAGAEALWLTAGLEAACALKRNGELLAGEVGGLRPEGFDFGNSPREAALAELAGRTVIHATTNGTKAAHKAAQVAHEVLLASLLNAPAATQLAGRLGSDVAILCAGKEGQVGIDDLYTAGVLAQGLLAEGFEPEGDGAQMALHLAQKPALPLLRASEAALALAREGLAADVDFCAQLGFSERVPRLLERRGEALVFG